MSAQRRDSIAADWLWWLIRLRIVLAAAAAYVLFAPLVVIAWHTPHLAHYVPDWLEPPLSKTNSGVMRSAHFLAIAILVDRLIPSDWAPSRRGSSSSQLRTALVGVFCLGVILAFAGYVAVVGVPNSATSQILILVLGIGATTGLGTRFHGTEQ